ncbi:hypothetical protein Ddye_001892 [Dipteronia dyeriana]|uniref:BED-type domain-containing protein n=1 Tax=Dipteronia dyeriana TaxID=168575 RepID=A0AAD9XQ24_9ROSI|nr:hypothetical protein Ddye_001892 [Dipteronia dyeriana]
MVLSSTNRLDGPDVMHGSEEDNGVEIVSCLESNIRKRICDISSASGSCRTRKRTSKVWKSFQMIENDANGKARCKCKFCGQVFLCPSTHGTGNMRRHLDVCTKMKMHDVQQMLLDNSSGTMSLSQYRDEDDLREAVAEAIVLHDLLFSFVEWTRIVKMIGICTNEFGLVFRNTAKADVLKLYVKEKRKVKTMLQVVNGRISLTSDLWTSAATDGFICLTTHFIYRNWVLRKKVLNFSFMDPPRDGISLSEKVNTLVCEWRIEKKLFSITLDNASSNNILVQNLKSHLNINKASVYDGEFLHIRCCAHIINLIVQDGSKKIDSVVHKIHESVKNTMCSQVRKQKFLECTKEVGLESRRGFRQDVLTIWNSTYLILDNTIYYRSAWCSFELFDTNYKHCPSSIEWEKAEELCHFLCYFMTLLVFSLGQSIPFQIYICLKCLWLI